MEDPEQVHEEIRQLKEDVSTLRQRLAKMREDLLKAAQYRRTFGNRRGRRASDDVLNLGRRASDRR